MLAVRSDRRIEPGVNQTANIGVVGLQWGDEGKGKLVDLLMGDFDAVVRFNGGANAGHSVVIGSERYALHLVPSGVLRPGKKAIIANGVAVDPETLIAELDGLEARGVDTSGLVVSNRAHVVMPYHKLEDALREDALAAAAKGAERLMAGEIGTTRRGIGPCYAEKSNRATAIRMGDLLHPEVLDRKLQVACRFKEATLSGLAGLAGVDSPKLDERELRETLLGWGKRLESAITDTVVLLQSLFEDGRRVLFEGANATLLDVDHGTYPYVTASNTCAVGISAGTGVAPDRVGSVIGVMKAYQTRVGAGPMPTEQANETGNRIRERGREYGTTTGRPRRVGWLDLVAARYAARLNGVAGVAVTLLDVLAGFDTLKVCVGYRVGGAVTDLFVADGYTLETCEPVYEELPGFSSEIDQVDSWEGLPQEARRYIEYIETFIGVPVLYVGVGPGRTQTIVRGGA
jgi:adenylosuccinate synthase